MVRYANAETPLIRFEEFPPTNAKPVFVATENGQGLNCNDCSFVKLPGPGFIRKDCGTIELKVKLEDDLRPLKEYRCLISIPLDPEQKLNNQLSIDFTPTVSEYNFSEGDLVFTIKDANQAYRATAKGLDWKAGSEHTITVSWGQEGMRLYVDGELAGTASYTGGLYSEAPEFISIGHHVADIFPADLILDELKISDVQRNASYVSAEATSGQAPQLDGNTLVLMHFDGSLAAEGALTTWRSTRFPIIMVNPRDYDIDSATNNVYSTGEDVAVDAMLFNSSPGNSSPLTLTATAKTFQDQVAAKVKIQVIPKAEVGWQNITVPLPLKDRVGWYSVTVELSDGDKVLSSFTTPCIVIPPPPQSRYEFGLDDYGSTPVPWLTMKRLGMRWLRPHNDHWNWNVLEPRKGEFDFSRTDSDVAGATANSIKLLPVLGLAPEWAAVPPDNLDAFKGGPNEFKANNWKYCWRPRDLEDYRNYVDKLVERYKGKIVYWEHYNEPDWHLPQKIGFAYGGTTAQFVEQMKVNADEIRKIDPNAKLVFPGIACTPLADPNFVSDVIKLGGMQYVDIVGMHSYGGYSYFATQIDLFRKAGYKGEIWQTEKLTTKDGQSPSTWWVSIYLLQIPDIVEAMALDVPVYIAHPQSLYMKGGVPQIESFVIPFFYRMVGERTYAGRIPGVNVHFFDGKEGPLLVCWGESDLKIHVGQDKVTLTNIYGESSVMDAPHGVLLVKGSPEVHYITPAPGKPFSLAQIQQPDLTAEPLINGNFEDLDGDAGLGALLPKGWNPSPFHNKGHYAADTEIYKDGKASLRVESSKDDKESVIQDVSLLSGHTYEISGWIRTESTNQPFANTPKACIFIWSRTLNKELAQLTETNVDSREFHLYTTKFTVPANTADNVISCVVYAGTDKAWFDGIEMKEIKP